MNDKSKDRQIAKRKGIISRSGRSFATAAQLNFSVIFAQPAA
ncbi:MAG: hypothetical protein ABWY35_05805 [Pseudorhodoplanes sp.]